ncbi:hypothetical protein Salat_1975400 [Sesamum alatum]|uniref:Uncharacterized protein n=1 Tax=Sesamum alatum TaxID=300844 RepID=A0AAE1Y554_9LAMI|nr:hypothetical protein Salat_1975400 [Sesamum alatum]
MEKEDWVIEVNKQVDSMRDTSAEIEQWEKRCIYWLPAHVTDLDNKAYKPQVVSIGPYHHGEPHLKPMDDHKHRALLHFLKRSAKPLQLYVEALAQVVQELKDAYDQLDPVWHDDTNAFLRMMVLDGKDMLLLENQVPMLVLSKLLAVEKKISQTEPHEYVNKLIVRFYYPGQPKGSLGNCLHLLDVYRKSLLYKEPRRSGKIRRSRPSHADASGLIPSAKELQDAGIRFKRSRFANLTFERFHVGAGNEVTSYVFFLDCLIRNPADVHVLSSHGIILNCLGSDSEVADLLNSVSRDVTLDPESSLEMVHYMVGAKLRNRFTRTLNEWQADFIRTYFKSPWAAISVIAAILYFGLTITQTAYSVLSYIHRK